MKLFDQQQIHRRFLRLAYKMAPFNLKGSWDPSLQGPPKAILWSCLIISNRPKELDLLLEDICWQNLEATKFEVIIINDGAGAGLREVVERYKGRLNVIYRENKDAHRVLSDLRNETLTMSGGKYIAFLDDDTRIIQKDFLSKAAALFEKQEADVLLASAQPLYGIIKAKYDFLDRFSFACRCCLYRREYLEDLGAFKANLNCYEDVELSMRLIIKEARILEAEELEYLHPPLYFESMRKPLSTGQAIFQMRAHYSFFVWLLIYLHTLRFLPYGISPNKISRQWFKISWGLLLFPFMGRSYYY